MSKQRLTVDNQTGLNSQPSCSEAVLPAADYGRLTEAATSSLDRCHSLPANSVHGDSVHGDLRACNVLVRFVKGRWEICFLDFTMSDSPG